MKLIRVKFRNSKSEKEYTYSYDGKVEVGDTVVVPVGNHQKHAIVTSEFDVKEIIRVGE